LIENVESEEYVESLFLLFENKAKSDGGRINHHEYDESNGDLVLDFEESSVAERVINFGPIKWGTNTYIAKKDSKSKSQ
jgi:hypothetical protein